MSQQFRFTRYDRPTLEPSAPVPLIALGANRFLLETDKTKGHASDSARFWTFRNPGADGRMQHMGVSLRLYRRVAV